MMDVLFKLAASNIKRSCIIAHSSIVSYSKYKMTETRQARVETDDTQAPQALSNQDDSNGVHGEAGSDAQQSKPISSEDGQHLPCDKVAGSPTNQQDDVASGTDNYNNEQVLVQAKQIPFFNDEGGAGTSPSLSIANKDDFLDDAKSFEDQDMIPDENEEVAGFVSEADLNDQNVQLRVCPGEERSDLSNRCSANDDDSDKKIRESKQDDDDDHQSQQFSIDDVTDDDEEEEERPISQQVSPKAAAFQEADSGEEPNNNNKVKHSETARQQLPTNDSTTNRYSSSSNQAFVTNDSASLAQAPPRGVVTKIDQNLTGRELLRPQPIETNSIQANIQQQQTRQEINIPPPELEEVPDSPGIRSSKASIRKPEPHLIKEDVVKGNYHRFMAHIETREQPKAQAPWKPKQTIQKDTQGSKRSLDTEESRSNKSKSEDSAINKDNEDPNAPAIKESDQFDSKELRQVYDGWNLYKKQKISAIPIRRYQMSVDQDYKRNKVTVCAHLQNIFNSFCVKRGKLPLNVTNYIDIDKLQKKFDPNSGKDSSPAKELRRVNTLANMASNGEEHKEKENYLLTKSNSTMHIPDNVRNKASKRIYSNFDKDLAAKMFGYRVLFKKKKMEITAPAPDASQAHKPIAKFAQDILNEVTQNYYQIPRYHTKQRILVPLADSDDEEDSIDHKDTLQYERQKQVAQSTTTMPEDSPLLNGSFKEATIPTKPINKRQELIKKFNGEFVVLKNRHGERQTYFKRARNLLWPCGPMERQQSAQSVTKRTQQANRSSAYGSQLFQQSGSPVRNISNSPKKTIGWNNVQAHKTPQTHVQMIRQLSMVRYQAPRQGKDNGSNSLKGQGGTNQNFNYYRRQNSYRKNQRNGRVDSAKGGRPNGFRNSVETPSNPAYRLINQGSMASTSDQNFIMNGGQQIVAQQDTEVANITASDQETNVVHLRDPKHIEGFGSNVVHVNVSCGQTVPEANPIAVPEKTSQAAAAAPEEDDAQTFIIQLSEEQTKQLAKGTLRLNGVLIPKDLSNLNYDQIMALLDSVNLPSTTQAADGAAKEEAKKTTQTPVPEPTKTPKESTTKMPKSQLYEHNKCVNGREYRKPASQALQNHNGNFGMATTAYSHQQTKKYNGSFNSAKANQLMGQTYSGNNTVTGQLATNSNNLLKLQQTQYAQDRSLASQLDTSELNGVNMKKPGRELVKGRHGHSNAPHKVGRLDSGSRQARAARGSAKPGDPLIGLQGQRTQNNSSLTKKTVFQQDPNPNLTRNVVQGASNSDWDMLTMINSHQKQLKNVTQVNGHPQISYEQVRRGVQLDTSLVSEKGKASAGQVSQGSKQDSFQRATLGQISSNTSSNHYASSGHQPFPSDPNQPVLATAYARQSMVSAQTSSQQMITTVQGATGGNQVANTGYTRTGQTQQTVHNNGSSNNGASQKQKSLTRLSSKKRIIDRKVGGGENNGLRHDSSRSYIKQQSARAGTHVMHNTQTHISNSMAAYNPAMAAKGSNPAMLFNNVKTMNEGTTNYSQHKQQQFAQAMQQQQQARGGNQCGTTNARNQKQVVQQANTQASMQQQTNQQVYNRQNYYQSSSAGSAHHQGGSGVHSGASTSMQLAHQQIPIMGPQVHANTPQSQPKSLITKNQLSSKYDNMVGSNKHHAHHPSQHVGQKMSINGQQHNSRKTLPANQKPISVDRGSGAVTQYYTRSSATEQDPAAKLRINNNTLTNMNYSNQSSTHKRKIESALAQSAINAIQNQSNVHNSIQMGATSGSVSASCAKSQFLQFEQKAYSYPKNEMTLKQPYLNQPGSAAATASNQNYIGKSSEFRKQQPAFIMRGNDNNTVSDFAAARKPQSSNLAHSGNNAPKSTTGFNFIQQHVISSKKQPAQQQASTLLKTGQGSPSTVLGGAMSVRPAHQQ